MTRLLRDKIETIDPGFGIEMMTLAAVVTEPLSPKQVASSLIEEREARRFGPDRSSGQPRRRTESLSHRAGRERRAGACGASHPSAIA